MRLIGPAILLACALAIAPVVRAETPPTGTTPDEAKLGAKVAEQIEKDYKLVKDETMIQKLNAMAAGIAPYTERPDVGYTCKILDTKELNAMAIPGGAIYFTKGLLAAAESDHEIAGVMAHEIAHNSLFHIKRTLEREAKLNIMQILMVFGAIYMDRRSSDTPTGAILVMSQHVKQALMNGYNVDLEFEADQHAVRYLQAEKKYDPVGLYSVILGFLQMERQHANPGVVTYLKTHPDPEERKAALEEELQRLGVRINLWRVVNFHAELLEPAEGKPGYGVQLGSVEVIRLTASDAEKDAKARAAEAVAAINRRLDEDYVRQFDVDLDPHDGKAYVRLLQIPVLSLTEDDARASGMALEPLGQLAVFNIKRAIWNETVKRG